jgi:hypothetical protein
MIVHVEDPHHRRSLPAIVARGKHPTPVSAEASTGLAGTWTPAATAANY